jgi:hypothetical protein
MEQLSEKQKLEEHHPQTGPTVQVTVNDKPVTIHRGRQSIAAIKTAAGVPLADRLDQLIDGKLTAIDQDGAVTLHGDEVFVSFLATGGSS